MGIDNVYVVTHPFHLQDSRLPEKERVTWRSQRLGAVSKIIDRCKSDPNAFMVYFCSGVEPLELMELLDTLPEERRDIVSGPNDYSLHSSKKLPLKKLSEEVEVSAFGAYIGACLRETTETVMCFIKDKTKIRKVSLLGGDSASHDPSYDVEQFVATTRPYCENIEVMI